MQKTENYELNLPEKEDFFDLEHFNKNTEQIDKLLCPEYTEEKTLTELSSGEKLATGFGKLAKAVKDLISHLADTVAHITATERTNWNDANSKKHTHTNKSTLDAITASYTTEEKMKLAGIAANANAYTHPTASGNKHIPSGGSSGQILRWSADGTAAWGADSNTTYSNATTSAAGLMSASDKSKLDGIASGANKTSIAANLTTATTGYALDATMGKTLYSYITALQTVAQNLQYCIGNFKKATYVSRSPSDLGNVKFAIIPYSEASKLTTSNKVAIKFTDGSVGIFGVVTTALLDNDVKTWLTGSVPYVAKSTIQGGTNTLALSSSGSGYTTWDEETYNSSGTVVQTMILEVSASSANLATEYRII